MLLNVIFFFFNDTATTEIYTLSLHDALPISLRRRHGAAQEHCRPDRGLRSCNPIAGEAEPRCGGRDGTRRGRYLGGDRKSTRLNSSHVRISYAVFCLKKKKRNYLVITNQ